MRILASICLVAVLATARPSAQDKGQALAPWTLGSLDIHHISTGVGNATFIRLPAGATLLVDAGGANRIPYADPKPNDTKRPGEWIAEYIRGTVGEGAALDYAVLTHFHPDHIGGLADVAAAVPIRRIIDRGSPSYAYLRPGGPPWHDLESDIARAMGQTDARQVGHHGSIEVENPFFLAATKSRVLVLPAWSPTHPSADVLKRMLSTRIYPDPRDVFVVQFREPTRASIGARANQVAGADGRVEPGGARYRVFVLDNTTPKRPITSVHGPYDAVK